jgi:hypothetical protein
MRVTMRVPRAEGVISLARAGFSEVGAYARVEDPPGPFAHVTGEPADGGSLASYLILLKALVRVNLWCIRTYRLPRLYTTDVIYCREPAGSEIWQSSSSLYMADQGDCEDLACHRTAELLAAGKTAQVDLVFKEKPDGGRLYHVVVRRKACGMCGCEDAVEDPSKRLGM